MGKYMNKKSKTLLLIIPAVMFNFLSINSAVYSQDSYADFKTIHENNGYQQYKDESDVYYKNGLAFLDSKQYTKAIDAFEKALNLTPDRTSTRVDLAIAYIDRGSYSYNKLKDVNNAVNDYRNAIYLLKYDSYVPANNDVALENFNIAKSNLDNILKGTQISLAKSSRLKMARGLRGEGKFREALVEFYEALEGNQTDLPVYIAIGDLSAALQNERTASKYYQKAVSYNSNNADLHLKLAKSLSNLGDTENAMKEYNIAIRNVKEEDKYEALSSLESILTRKIQENPQDASLHIDLGVVLQKKGDLDGALREYQYAESINPDDITTRLNIGTLLQAKKDYVTALNAYDSILQIKPDDLLVHYYRGTVLREMKEYEAAVKEFQFVLNKEPNNINAKSALFDTIKQFPNDQDISSILKYLAENNPTDATAQYKYGYQLHSANKFDEALDYYKKTIAINPKYLDAYLNTAVIYKQKNQPSLAISALQSALLVSPKNPKVTEMLTSLKSETATTRYQNALKKHNEGKFAEAIKEYLSIIQISEPDADLYVNLGAAYQASKNLTSAANAYLKATQIDSKNSTAFYYLGTVYSAQGKNQDALKAYQKALTLDPSNKDVKQALADAKQALSDSALQKGIDEYNKAKYNEALLTFNTLSIKDPSNGYVYYYRGMVYDAIKKYQLAIADYKLAVKHKPDLSYAYYAVAVDYDTLKNYAEAKKWYRFFVDNSENKTDQYVKYARDRIKQI